MQIHEFIQGSPEWHLHRKTHRNASDAPAVKGVSSYKTRSQLMHEMHTGLSPEIDASTQARFDEGHRSESLARTWAEELIGQDLYPVTGSHGEYSASFDGLTMAEDIAFEHKSLNDKIRAVTRIEDLGIEYRIQMEHQLMVSGANKCLFMASKWDSSGALIEEKHFWYEPDLALRAEIVAAWDMFAKDLAAYTTPETVEEVTGKTPESLPALRIEITGMVTASNLAEFKETALAVFNGINTNLQTDQDFADAEKAVKFCKDAEERLDAAKQHALSQTASIDELFRTIDSIKKASSEVRLKLDKLVKSEKENRKAEIADKARVAFNAHFIELEKEITPIRLIAQHPDFGGAMRNMKKLSAMQDAVDTALRNGMFEADSAAKEVRGKLAWMNEYWFNNGGDYKFLFSDLQALIGKPLDDFKLVVTTRIDAHKKAEAAKLEEQRTAIQKEEQEKAEAKVRSEQERAERDNAMLRAAAIAEEEAEKDLRGKNNEATHAEQKATEPPQAPLSSTSPIKQSMPKEAQQVRVGNTFEPPLRGSLITCVCFNFSVSYETAEQWLTNEFQQQRAA